MNRDKYYYWIVLPFLLVPLIAVAVAAFFGTIRSNRSWTVFDMILIALCLGHLLVYFYLVIKFRISKNASIGVALVTLGATATVQIPFMWISNPSLVFLAGCALFFMMIDMLFYGLVRGQI